MDDKAKLNRFLLKNPENGDYNQYWYSPATIDVLVEQVVLHGKEGTAFLSTPSVYFSLAKDIRQHCSLFDVDDKWKDDAGFVKYDFNEPHTISASLHGAFAMVVIDPPFITREVWLKYAQAAHLLLRKGGKILATTIPENASMMKELLGLTEQAFKPSIPNLVYQYSIYTNFDSKTLVQKNPEVPDDAS